MKAVHARRLLKLADFLKKLPVKRFDYTSWVGVDWEGAPDLSCGTTACALGWATTIPEFRRLGLRLKRKSPWGGFPALVASRGGPTSQAARAVEKIFGLDQSAFRFLFMPAPFERRATPREVAKKIRQFVREETSIVRSTKEAKS